MKNFIFLLLLFNLNLFSQETKLTWSKKIPTEGNHAFYGGNQGNYYSRVFDKKGRVFGRVFDKDLNLISENLIIDDVDNKKKEYFGSYLLENGMTHMVLERNKKVDKFYLFSYFTDYNFNSTSKNVELLVADERRVTDFGTNAISPDKSKLCFYYTQYTKNNEFIEVSYKVHSSDFKEIINTGYLTLPINSINYSFDKLRVDNSGKVYLLVKIKKEKSEQKEEYSKFYYKLFVLEKDKIVKEFDFDYIGNEIGDFELKFDNNELICTGFLGDLSCGNLSIVGNIAEYHVCNITDKVFITKINSNSLEIVESNMIKLEGLYPEKLEKNSDYVPYVIKRIDRKSNGGYSILAEQYKQDVIVMNNNTGTHYNYINYYCDVACIQTDEKFNVESITRIPKYQKNSGNASIASTFKNDKTYVVFEDLTKNEEAVTEKEVKKNTKTAFNSTKRNSIYLITINEKGEFTKELLYDYKDMFINPKISASKEIKPGEILFNAYDIIGKLEIN